MSVLATAAGAARPWSVLGSGGTVPALPQGVSNRVVIGVPRQVPEVGAHRMGSGDGYTLPAGTGVALSRWPSNELAAGTAEAISQATVRRWLGVPTRSR